MSTISIAIDGPSGAGKSTMAKRLAKELGFLYVDTGAIYRTVSLYACRKGLAPTDGAGIAALLPEIHIDLVYGEDGTQQMILNGENVSGEIRTPQISMYTSAVSAIPAVRAFLLELQRDMAKRKNLVMDGRDIGTVVLPDANIKLFLTAAPEARAKRRWLELREKGDPITYDQVLADVVQRDENDTHRAIAPLKQAEDAVLVDTTEYDLEESYQLLLRTIRERM
ncbi:MAG: (d)CMP kinase [Clostridiales bacterium]|nr:(d)CMP kinase [Clostridiales bacterium]